MQFKYPELLWALLLLIIPVIIHLFQLRRYKKTAFTNVMLLQKVVSQTRKSHTLKKWLLLITRMLLFASLILAFAQPYMAREGVFQKVARIIYLDDSFSTQARSEKGELLQQAIQELLQLLPSEEPMSLFTNVETYSDVSPASIKNELIGLPHTYNQFRMDDILIKAGTMYGSEENSSKELLVISDFQERMFSFNDSVTDMDLHLIQLEAEEISNISIDSIYIGTPSPTQLQLRAILSSTGTTEPIPVSMWNADTLIAKTAANFTEAGIAEVIFSLPKDMVIDGRVEINDTGLTYDNQLFFNVNRKDKIRALSVGPESPGYLERIFKSDEFVFEQLALNDLNYSAIERQNLVVVNQLNTIPIALQNALLAFYQNGGSVVVVPSADADINNYNQFLFNFRKTRFTEKVETEHQITTIAFEHPLFSNVFEQTVSNFQYPLVRSFFRTTGTLPTILSMENGEPFLSGEDGIYVFSSPINQEQTNFMNSPLIVPTLYNMGAKSLRLPSLYHLLSSSTSIDIPVSLPQDGIARVVKDQYEFIPLQQSYTNKTTLDFEEYPAEDGIFDIVLQDSLISRISFNYPREESELRYADLSGLSGVSVGNDISEVLRSIENENKVKELWLPFVILALLFAIAEVLIQKFVR